MEENPKKKLTLYIHTDVVEAVKELDINKSEAVEKFFCKLLKMPREKRNVYLGKHKKEGQRIDVVGVAYIWKNDKYVKVK